MKTEQRIVAIDSDGGWHLQVWQLGGYYRLELTDPDGLTRLQKSLLPSLDGEGGVYEAVRNCLCGQKLDHVAVALNAMSAAELAMSGQAVPS